MPDMDPSSEQLHRVVELSSGINDVAVAAVADDDDVTTGLKPPAESVRIRVRHKNPVDKLKEALSSKAAFQKYYLVCHSVCCLDN